MISLHSYIRELLHATSEGASISSSAVDSINNLLNLVLEKLIHIASERTAMIKRRTLNSGDIRFALRFLVTSELYDSADRALAIAVLNWNSDFSGAASKRAKIIFPPTRIQTKAVRPLTSASRVAAAVGVALAGVLQHLATLLLSQSVGVAAYEKRVRINPSDVLHSIKELPELESLFEGVLASGTYI